MSKLIIPEDANVNKFVPLKFYKNKFIYILFNLCFCDVITTSQVKNTDKKQKRQKNKKWKANTAVIYHLQLINNW